MAAPSGTKWGSVSSNGSGKLGLYISASTTNTQVTLTVQVWLALKWNINDSSNSYTFSYTNNSGGTSYGAKGTSLSLNFGTTSGSGWADASQKKLATYTLTYTRGTSSKSVKLYSSLKNLGSSKYSVSVSTSYTISAKPSYTISYNANSGFGEPSSQTKWYGTNITLSSTKPTRTGYSFQGWGTSTTDTSVDYAAGATYSANASITLYAIWKANTYTISYDPNGGTDAPSNQTKTYGVSLTLSSTKPTRTNYNFKGWGTSASATTVSYAAGASYTENTAITLYAIWELAYVIPRITNYTVTRCNSGGTASDEGTYAKVVFNWACDKTVSSIIIEWKTESDTKWSSDTVSVSGTSGSVSKIVGGSIVADKAYSIKVTVTDTSGSNFSTKTLNGTLYPIDVLAGGNGVAFGKVAELSEYADFKFKGRFREGVYFNNDKHIFGYDADGAAYIALMPVTAAGNMSLGYGLYNAGKGHTNIYGNDVQFYTKTGVVDFNNNEIYLNNDTRLYLRNTDGDIIETINLNDANNLAFGWGGYNLRKGSTGIYGNNVNINYNNTFKINGRDYGVNKVLASPGWYMKADQTVNLSEPVSSQPHGIVLAWSAYTSGEGPKNYDWYFGFVPKYHINIANGTGCFFINPYKGMYKYVYIHNTKIVGNSGNYGTGKHNGISCDGANYVLRYVVGV